MTALTSFYGALTWSPLAATVLAHVTVAGVAMVGANLLMPKADFGSTNTRQSLNVRGRNQRNATTNRQYIYGEVKVGGTVAYMGTSDKSGNDNAYLHMVLVHCDHEVEDLGDLYVNGEKVLMASGGEGVLRTTSSATNRFYESLYIADHLGGPSQTSADSTLDAATGDIDAQDAFKGMAYTYIRMELKQPSDANPDEENAFPSGIPQFQRVVKGMKVYDPREVGHDPDDSTTWEYSANWALCVAHFLQSDFGYGRYGLTYDEINETELIASANNSDEEINELWTAWQASESLRTLGYTRSIGSWLLTNSTGTGGITGTTQPDLTGLGVGDTVSDGGITWTLSHDGINSGVRYELNGMVDSHEDPIEVLRKMRTAASGMVEYVGGEWIVRSGRYIAATVTINESDFASGISGTTKDDRTSAVNTVKGVITDKLDSYQVIDAPSVTNATFVTEDGGIESVREMELMYTNSHKTAQRLFKIELNKARQSITHKASFTSKAMQLQVGDNFQLNFAKYGYVNKVFEVWSHQLVVNNGALQVEMEFRETATNVYDWDHATDETALDPSPNTTLPSPFTVPVGPTPTVTSGTATLVQTADGTIIPSMHVSWTPVSDMNVIGYEVRFEKTAGVYRSVTINGRESSSTVFGSVLELSTYPVEIRCITPLKIGLWGTATNHQVIGKSAAPTAPTGFTASGIVDGVQIAMDEHPDIDFKQFRIFENTVDSKPGTHSYTTTDMTKTITGLTAGTLLYFWLEAEDTTGHTTDFGSSVTATPSAFASDLSSTTLSVQMEVGQSGIPTDWSDFDMTVGFYVEGASASWTASTPTASGQYTITGESATPSGVTMLSTGSRPTVGVRGWPVGYGDFVVRKTYYVQYMDAAGTLRNFSIDREWHRTQRFVLGPPRFNPVNEPAKGGTGLTFKLNYITAVTANDGEVFVGGTTFTKPDGTTTTGISENYVGTPYEGAISPTTGTVGDFLLMWTDTAADTRFTPLTFTHQNVVPIREAAAGGYEVFNNVGTAQAITLATTDVLLAAVWRDDTTTGLTGIERYVDQNPGQSDNFVTGTSGYKIDAVTGDAEFNDGTFRGEVSIGSGDDLCSITSTSFDYGDKFRIDSPGTGQNELTISNTEIINIGASVGDRVRLQGDNVEIREYIDNVGSFDEFYYATLTARELTINYDKAITAGTLDSRLNNSSLLFHRDTWEDTIEIGWDSVNSVMSIDWDGDTNLYRSAADVLKTDDDLIVGGGDVTVGLNTTDSNCKVFFSDGSSTVQKGWGMEFTRSTSYLRPTGTSGSQTMYLGNSGFLWDQVNIYGDNKVTFNNATTQVGIINLADGSAQFNGSVSANTGLNVGVDDTTAGRINIFGGSSGEGGELRIYNDISDDDTYDYYRLDTDSAGRFRIGRAGTTDIYLAQDGNTGIGGLAAATTKFHVEAPTYSGAHINYDGTSNDEFGLRIESNASAGNFESDFANGTTAMLDLYANSATTSGGDFLVARTQSATEVFLFKATGSLQINGTERLPATKPTVTDADTSHILSDFTDTEAACDALGTKINSILSYLNL